MARGTKDDFGENWWAKQWNAALTRFGYASRLHRGMSYARTGKVKECQVERGAVKAKVSGSRPRPYKVTIKVKVLSATEWEKVVTHMSSKAIFSARLLAGIMPEEIEEAFLAAGVSLFPSASQDLVTDCSCPDYANPCKHIAAVYYILGLEFDRDPFMIFLLRGMGKEQVIEKLRMARNAKITKQKKINSNSVKTAKRESLILTPEGLIKEMASYKGLPEDFMNMDFSFEPPRVPYMLIKRLGIPPFWEDQASFEYAVLPYYTGMQDYIEACLSEDD